MKAAGGRATFAGHSGCQRAVSRGPSGAPRNMAAYIRADIYSAIFHNPYSSMSKSDLHPNASCQQGFTGSADCLLTSTSRHPGRLLLFYSYVRLETCHVPNQAYSNSAFFASRLPRCRLCPQLGILKCLMLTCANSSDPPGPPSSMVQRQLLCSIIHIQTSHQPCPCLR